MEAADTLSRHAMHFRVPVSEAGDVLEFYQLNGHSDEGGFLDDAIVTADAYEPHTRRQYPRHLIIKLAQDSGFRLVDSHTVCVPMGAPFRYYLALLRA